MISTRTSLAALLLVLRATAGWSDDVRTQVVQFEVGTSGTTIEDHLKGYGTVHYLLGAGAGQTLTVEMTTDAGAAYFNVFEPGKQPGHDEAMFIGGRSFESELAIAGDYLVQVYQVRSAARRAEVARYALDVRIVGERAHDALVPGTDFHATGRLPCARYESQPIGDCEFGVKRSGAGDAEVVVFWLDGGSRSIFFESGMPKRSDAQAELTSARQFDLHSIIIGSERFEVVDAIITGG